MSNDNKPKVICLGLGRTGTSSLRDALEIIGFGPCYHMSVVFREDCEDMATWCKVGEGNATMEDIRSLLDPYGSILDYPAAIYGQELYAAYPDAKYILTTRDPAKWAKSMNNTILRFATELLKVSGTVKSPEVQTSMLGANRTC
ncbi:hypothetical protein K439DRAFT_862684 [Ramaria rubella]|nr:hypothetical protein K439DRAFT_862684 [Ramaria rubella]